MSKVITSFNKNIDGENMAPFLFELSSRYGVHPKEVIDEHPLRIIGTNDDEISIIVKPIDNGYDANINHDIGWRSPVHRDYIERIKEAVDSVYHNTDLNIFECVDILILYRVRNEEGHRFTFSYKLFKYYVEHP
jgi:hypothetical protein